MSRKTSTAPKDAPASEKKKQNNLVNYAVIFIVGFLCGVAFTIMKSDTPAPPPGNASSGAPHDHGGESEQAILNLEAQVTANPNDFSGWTQLGNLYFDTDQPQKAVHAYEKALELHTGNANIYTDLGVMYRRTNQPEKAVATFEKAIEMEPSHLPARFNKGIVLMFDLGDAPGAIAIWESILTIEPQARAGNGEPLRDFIDRIKADQKSK